MAMSAGSRSLGGYGGSTIGAYYGGGSTAYVPYSGNAHGFIPYRGATSGAPGMPPVPRRLPQTSMGGTVMADTPIGGGSLAGGMGMAGSRRGTMKNSTGTGRGPWLPFGYEGGIGMGGMAPVSGGMGTRPMSTGPGFGYPFRMPMSFGAPSSMGMP
jgi:hypothetical protein